MKNYILFLCMLNMPFALIAQQPGADLNTAIAEILQNRELLDPFAEINIGTIANYDLMNLATDDSKGSLINTAAESVAITTIQGSVIEPYLDLEAELYKNKFIVLSYGGLGMTVSCYVTNEKGETVYMYPIPLSGVRTYLDLDHLQAGKYFLRIRSQGQIFQQPFVKK